MKEVKRDFLTILLLKKIKYCRTQTLKKVLCTQNFNTYEFAKKVLSANSPFDNMQLDIILENKL